MGRWTKIKVALLPSSTLTGFSSPSFSSYTFYPSPSISHSISIYLSASSLWGWEGGGGQWWRQHRGGPWPRQMRGEVATARKNKASMSWGCRWSARSLLSRYPLLASTPGPAIRNISRRANERERERGRGEINGGSTQLVGRVDDTFC